MRHSNMLLALAVAAGFAAMPPAPVAADSYPGCQFNDRQRPHAGPSRHYGGGYGGGHPRAPQRHVPPPPPWGYMAPPPHYYDDGGWYTRPNHHGRSRYGGRHDYEPRGRYRYHYR